MIAWCHIDLLRFFIADMENGGSFDTGLPAHTDEISVSVAKYELIPIVEFEDYYNIELAKEARKKSPTVEMPDVRQWSKYSGEKRTI